MTRSRLRITALAEHVALKAAIWRATVLYPVDVGRLGLCASVAVAVFAATTVAGCARPNPEFQAGAEDTAAATGDGGQTTSTTGPGSSSSPSSSDGGTTAKPSPLGTGTGDATQTTDGSESTASPPPTTTTGVGSEETGLPAEQSCCEVHPEPGCDDKEVEACVCANDGFCCAMEGTWDSLCASESELCGADCGFAADCCELSPTPGCGQPVIEACVCMLAGGEICCAVEWDAACSALAAEQCNVQCPSVGSCCALHGTPGCSIPSIEECVCDEQGADGCCVDEWSEDCVAIAELGCGLACAID